MSKKSFSTSGLDVLNLRSGETANPEQEQPSEDIIVPELAIIAPVEPEPEVAALAVQTTPKAPKKTTSKPNKPKPIPAPQPQTYVRKSYYVTPEQHKAIKVIAANGDFEGEKDVSAIVRVALDMYLTKRKK